MMNKTADVVIFAETGVFIEPENPLECSFRYNY